MQTDLTNEILLALAAADPQQKAAALRALKGEIAPPVAPSDGPLLYTVTEAAKRLNISRSTLWRVLISGRLSKVELYPGCARIRRTDVEALAAGIQPTTSHREERKQRRNQNQEK